MECESETDEMKYWLPEFEEAICIFTCFHDKKYEDISLIEYLGFKPLHLML